MDSHTNGIYRYYLPDGTIDLLVTGLPLDIRRETFQYKIVSNVTLSWCCTDLATLAEMEEYWNYDSTGGEGRTPRVFFAEIMGQDFATAADFLAANNTERIHQYEELLDYWLYRGKSIYSEHYYYQNFLTGEKHEAYGYAYHQRNELYYPDGSERPREEYPQLQSLVAGQLLSRVKKPTGGHSQVPRRAKASPIKKEVPMKRFAILLALALLLAGCAAAPAEPTATSPLASVDHSLDAANSYLLSGNFYRFLPYKNFCYKFDHLKSLILYYDCDNR